MITVDKRTFPQSLSKFLKTCGKGVWKLLSAAEEKGKGGLSSMDVIQNHKLDTSKGKDAESAKAFMTRVAEVGFGSIEPGNTEKSLVFRMIPHEEMSKTCKVFIDDKK